MATPIYDGIEAVSGVSGANPSLIPRNLLASATNCWLRYDENKPRLGFRHIQMVFVDDTDGNNKKLFDAGNLQGATFYYAYPSFQVGYIIVSIAGVIFKIQIVGKTGYVEKLFEGNDPLQTHAWFGQAFEWLVIQDGKSKPILWNGSDAARRAVAGEVPTGSVMAFIHGRLAVASSDGTNQIAVGDIVYGSDATTTTDVIRFTETEYWAEGGAFGAPVFVGDIMGMVAMPYLDTGTGQNELVILGTDAAVSLDLSKPRSQWLNNSLLRISLIGAGCVSSHSPVTLNADLLFRDSEGVRSFRNARAEFESRWKQTPISSDVRRWIDYDSPELLQYCQQLAWNNMLFSTVQPRTEQANNPFAGHHRYHLGFCVLDAQPESTTLPSGAPIWQGMWTGIRPTAFVQGRIGSARRGFAFSYDCDGYNRLYEFVPSDTADTVEGQRQKIRRSFITSNLGVIERVSNNFELKKILGGSIEFSDVKEKVETTVQFRPNNSQCYLDVSQFTVGCDCKETTDCDKPKFSLPSSAVKHLPEPSCQPLPGTTKNAGTLYHTQFKVSMEGWAKVDRLRVRFERQPDSEVPECGEQCLPIQCCTDEFYCFSPLLPPPVPDLPGTEDDTTYEATATYTAVCPAGSVGSPVTATRTAQSEISYEDAYKKARDLAVAQAITQLNCCSCTPGVIFAFTANNNTTDLSQYFAQTYGSCDMGRPWRLIETQSDTIYAEGLIGSEGSLETTWTLTGYDSSFDPDTDEFVDTGMDDAFMELQLGCVVGGGNAWP